MSNTAAEVSNVSFRCDAKLKKQAETLFDKLGLNMSTALTMFLSQSVREGGIPFSLTINTPNSETVAAMLEVDEMLANPKQSITAQRMHLRSLRNEISRLNQL